MRELGACSNSTNEPDTEKAQSIQRQFMLAFLLFNALHVCVCVCANEQEGKQNLNPGKLQVTKTFTAPVSDSLDLENHYLKKQKS